MRRLWPASWAANGMGLLAGCFFATLLFLSFKGLPNPDPFEGDLGSKRRSYEWPSQEQEEKYNGGAAEKGAR